ncbi:MAG: hypothetical protein IMZ58_07540 [Thermoplasmata archaeon]|nr:hypothetical protein [Thermoplasmata archaeon]
MGENIKTGYEPRYREISLPIFLHCLNKYKGDNEAFLKKLNDFMHTNTNQSIVDFKSWLKEQIRDMKTNEKYKYARMYDDILDSVLSFLEEKKS